MHKRMDRFSLQVAKEVYELAFEALNHKRWISGQMNRRSFLKAIGSAALLPILPRYLSAIGTVTPIATVTVQSRVAGQIGDELG